MFGTFILGGVAGWVAPYAEPRIQAALDGMLKDETPITPKVMALLSLAVCLLAAAVLSMVFFVPHAAPLTLGGVAGVLAPKLVEKWRSRKTPDYDS